MLYRLRQKGDEKETKPISYSIEKVNDYFEWINQLEAKSVLQSRCPWAQGQPDLIIIGWQLIYVI